MIMPTLRYIFHIITKISEKELGKYNIKGRYLSACSLFESEDEESMQSWLRTAKEQMDFLLIDDAKPEHIKTVTKNFVGMKLKVFPISPLDLDYIISFLPHEPKLYWL